MIKRIFVRAILGVVMTAVLALAGGCTQSNKVNVGDERNGQEVTIKQDQLLTVKLESNPTTGYGWEIAACDEAVLQAQGEAVYEQASQGQNLVGGGGWQTFQFKPVKAGETPLKLVYRRAWEKDVEPIKDYEVLVNVQ